MNQSPADTIKSLAADIVPVEPVPLPRARFRTWLLLGGLALALAIVAGVRRDWSSAVAAWPVLGRSLLLACAAGSGAWSALRLSTPGEARSRAVAWPLLFAGVWAVWMISDLARADPDSSAWLAGFGWRCLVRALAGATVAGVMLLLLVRRAMPLAVGAVAVAVAASTAAVGELAAEWMCPNTRALHLLAWHGAPLITVIVLVAVFSYVSAGRRHARASGDYSS